MTNTAKKRVVEPLRPANFGAYAHQVKQFSAVVSGELTKKDLEDPALWVNVAKSMTMGDTDVRIMADDMSFIAYGMCTYCQGSTAKIKIIAFHELDEVTPDTVDPLDDYIVKLRGPKKWCIINQKTGEVVKEGIDKQIDAMRELEDYKRILST